MTASKVWSGIYDATGGYLIVKDHGLFCVIIFIIETNLRIIYLQIQNLKLQVVQSMTLVNCMKRMGIIILN